MTTSLYKIGDLVRHIRTDGLYIIVGLPQNNQLTSPRSPAYAYVRHSGDMSVTFLRPQAEMEDGRFEVLTPGQIPYRVVKSSLMAALQAVADNPENWVDGPPVGEENNFYLVLRTGKHIKEACMAQYTKGKLMLMGTMIDIHADEVFRHIDLRLF